MANDVQFARVDASVRAALSEAQVRIDDVLLRRRT
jgi:hypothetical protein